MLPTYKTAELSTAHITENDSKLLAKTDVNFILTVVDYEYGFFIFVPSEEVWKDFNIPHKLKEQKFSSAFIGLLETCKKEGLRLINLDRDADTCKDLPTFDW